MILLERVICLTHLYFLIKRGFLNIDKEACPYRGHFIYALHNSAAGGHSGVHATYQRMKKLFYLPGMKSDVSKFVLLCNVCKLNKSEHTLPAGLLQPLPVPLQPRSDISMDFF